MFYLWTELAGVNNEWPNIFMYLHFYPAAYIYIICHNIGVFAWFVNSWPTNKLTRRFFFFYSNVHVSKTCSIFWFALYLNGGTTLKIADDFPRKKEKPIKQLFCSSTQTFLVLGLCNIWADVMRDFPSNIARIARDDSLLIFSFFPPHKSKNWESTCCTHIVS